MSVASASRGTPSGVPDFRDQHEMRQLEEWAASPTDAELEELEQELEARRTTWRYDVRMIHRKRNPPVVMVHDSLNPSVEVYVEEHHGELKIEVESKGVFDVTPFWLNKESAAELGQALLEWSKK